MKPNANSAGEPDILLFSLHTVNPSGQEESLTSHKRLPSPTSQIECFIVQDVNNIKTLRMMSLWAQSYVYPPAWKQPFTDALRGWRLKNNVSAAQRRPRSTSHPPQTTEQARRWRWQELFGYGEAHSPSGSPHSVHCDSKQGPKRDNRRLITHTWRLCLCMLDGDKWKSHCPLICELLFKIQNTLFLCPKANTKQWTTMHLCSEWPYRAMPMCNTIKTQLPWIIWPHAAA